MCDAEFSAAYKRAKDELLAGAVNQLRRFATQFVSTLATIAKSERKPAAARVTAASRGLELLIKVSEVEDLRARLEKLEQLAGDEKL
jgi:hypothetical protein